MNLEKLHIIQAFPGRFGFVGKVPLDLIYEQQDGTPLTEKQREMVRHLGPGNLSQYPRIKSTVFLSRQEALDAFEAWKEANPEHASQIELAA